MGDEWPMAGRTPHRSASSPVNLAGVPVPGWWQAPRLRPVSLPSPPVIRYDRVYTGLSDGAYYCIDRNSGRIQWRLPVWPLRGKHEAPAGPVGAAGKPGMATTPSGAIGAPGSLPPLAAPAVFDGLVYVGTPSGVVSAVDAQRGRLVWQVPVQGPVSCGPAVAGDLVYVTTGKGQVAALEAKTGAIGWQRQLDAPPVGPCAVSDDLVFVVDDRGTVLALDMMTGAVRWRQSDGPPGSPVFATVVMVAGGRALDPHSGEVLWSVPELAPPALQGDQLCFPSGAVDACTGEYRWRGESAAPTGHPPEGAAIDGKGGDEPSPGLEPDREQAVGGLVAAGDLVLAATAGGRLVAWQAADGAYLWSVFLGAPAAHAPAVAPGLVAVTLTDGSVRTVRVRPQRRERGAG